MTLKSPPKAPKPKLRPVKRISLFASSGEFWYDRGMNFENIEVAYQLLLENCHYLETQGEWSLYEALVEQNALYLEEDCQNDLLQTNNQTLRDLGLTKEEWRRTFQFLFIKAGQEQFLQANHHFTPDSVGFILLFLIETLTQTDSLEVLEIGSGTGNLAQTLLNNSQKSLDYLGIEVDDLLIDLAASIAEVVESPVAFLQGDAVRPQILKKSDIILSDLPVGYYPNDEVASRYQTAATDGHSYAHHLLIEQSLKYLKDDGLALLIAPADLLTSPQSPLLKKWLQTNASILAVITLPEPFFGNQQNQKSIFVLQKQTKRPIETFVYPLGDLQKRDVVFAFMEKVKKWKEDNGI